MKANKYSLIFVTFLTLLSTNLLAQGKPVASFVKATSGEEKKIILEWEMPAKCEPKIESVQIFRAKKPCSTFQEIQSLNPIAKVDASQNSYTDILSVPGDYFYVVLAETQKGLYKIVIPGVNATSKGVRPKIPAKTAESAKEKEEIAKSPVEPAAENRIRNAPLPNPGTLLGFNQGRAKMSEKSKKAAKELGSQKRPKAVEFKSPYFFEEDMFSPDGGDEYTLFECLRGGLAPKKYAESVQLLQDFLSVHRSKASTERAQFYLGQSHYFCQDYEKAIRCFLTVQDAFPELSKQWIDSSLDLLTIN